MADPEQRPLATPGAASRTAEPQAKSLDALLDSLNGSAERFQTLWFSFLGLTLYFAITALATTHRMLLLGEAQTLPILNIKVELLPFYIISPLLYFVFHFYVLIMLVLLARTAMPFDSELRKALSDDAKQELYRARVENALFLQLLVGMRAERAGFTGVLLAAIALLTIVVAPLATLILIQLMFLPYHSVGITWWHRGIVIADVALIIVMAKLVCEQSGMRSEALFLPVRDKYLRPAGWALGFSLIAMTFWLSGWEGRWAGEPGIGRPDPARTENGIVWGLFSDRLILKDEIIVGKDRIEEARKEAASRGGVFWVPTRKFDRRDLQGANFSGADMRGVDLTRALMRNSDLMSAQLEGAKIIFAQLQRADLSDARMEGADLSGADMRGANLYAVKLAGASLFQVKFQGDDLSLASLLGASMNGAELQGADLKGAQLQLANLSGAQLQGADLTNAYMQGADLTSAQLDGAVLEHTNLADANLSGVTTYNTDSRAAMLARSEFCAKSTRNSNPEFDIPYKINSITDNNIKLWIEAATENADATSKQEITNRFVRLNPDFAKNSKKEFQFNWEVFKNICHVLDPDGVNYRERLAELFSKYICDAHFAPYVAHELLMQQNEKFANINNNIKELQHRMLLARSNSELCPGIVGLYDTDWSLVELLAK